MRKSSYVFALFIGFAALYCLQTGFATLHLSGLHGWVWELHDPVCTGFNFIPGFRVVQYELLNHGQLLWSNLRALGMPLLGNEVQAAPLFPLTLGLVWLPEDLAWGLMVLLRLTLAGAGAWLLARDTLALSRWPAAVFMLAFALGVYVFGWSNHPWQNGFMAGIWYLYFVGRRLKTDPDDRRGRLGSLLGLGFAAFCMVTSGFPEAATLAAVLAVLIFGVLIPWHFLRERRGFLRFSLDFGLAHVIGLCFASPQFLALVEFIGTVNDKAGEFRAAPGAHHLEASHLRTYLVHKVTFFTDDYGAQLELYRDRHVFGLLTVFLCLFGLMTAALPGLRRRLDVVALGCAAFFFLKMFALVPWLSDLMNRVPVLNQSEFTVYFLPVLLFPVGYFAGRGVQLLAGDEPAAAASPRGVWVCFGIAAFSVLGLANAAAIQVMHAPYLSLVTKPNSPAPVEIVGLLLALIALSAYALRRKRPRAWLGFLIVALVLREQFLAIPHNFARRTDAFASNSPGGAGTALAQAIQQDGIPFYEARVTANAHGIDPTEARFNPLGIPGPDDGAPAILPERLQKLREGLFQTDWGGYLPLKERRYPHAWEAMSTGYFVAKPEDQSFIVHAQKLATWPVEGDPRAIARDPQALPRAYVASACRPTESRATALNDVVADADVPGTAFIEDLTVNEAAFCAAYHRPLARVPILSDQGAALQLADVQGPAVLVLNDNLYPGWTAVDVPTGEPLTIKATNEAFRGLVLPEARAYRVAWHYRPPWLPVSIAMIATGLVLLLATVYRLGRKDARTGGARSPRPS